jgi:hypothetical protein
MCEVSMRRVSLTDPRPFAARTRVVGNVGHAGEADLVPQAGSRGEIVSRWNIHVARKRTIRQRAVGDPI